jgi:glycosyltransferase involved in cell wall biosynthesis
MRILVFSPFYPPHKGGLESHSDEFNKYLSAQGTQVSVFTPRIPQDSPEREIRHDGVGIIRFPALELIHNYPLPKFWQKRFWQLWQELYTKPYDVVISRTRFFFTSLMALRFVKKTALPLVHIEHGSDFTHFNNSFKTWLGMLYDRTCGAFVLRHSDRVIGNSEASARFVYQLSGRDCTVIYRGVEKEIILATAPNDSIKKLYPEKLIIGFVGRLIDGKGVYDLIDAFSLIQHREWPGKKPT